MKDNKIIYIDAWLGILKKTANMRNKIDDIEIKNFINVNAKNLKEKQIDLNFETIKDFHKNTLIDIEYNFDYLEECWGEGFVWYKSYLNNHTDFSESYINFLSEYVDKTENEEVLIYVLRYLNGRAIQIANGILVSLRNGYPDDAYSRVRTLYEIYIIIVFIAKYGYDIAFKYLNHTGKWYEWADSILCKGKKITKFYQIEDELKQDVNLKKCIMGWRKEYEQINKIIHASAQGTFSRFGEYMIKQIPIGNTDKGIDLVAINTINIMSNILQAYFIGIHNNMPDLSNSKGANILSCIENNNMSILSFQLIGTYLDVAIETNKNMQKKFIELREKNGITYDNVQFNYE